MRKDRENGKQRNEGRKRGGEDNYMQEEGRRKGTGRKRGRMTRTWSKRKRLMNWERVINREIEKEGNELEEGERKKVTNSDG